jgi:hypothetical protein
MKLLGQESQLQCRVRHCWYFDDLLGEVKYNEDTKELLFMSDDEDDERSWDFIEPNQIENIIKEFFLELAKQKREEGQELLLCAARVEKLCKK